MDTVLERERIADPAARDEAAALHNAQINERYQRLLNAEAEQFAQFEEESERVFAPRASVLAPERPAESTFTQQPKVTEFVRPREDMSIFTPEALDKAIEMNAPVAPVAPAAPVMEAPARAVAQPVQAPQAVAVASVQYSLNTFAKAMIAAFVAVVIVMLTVIGINSNIIRQKRLKVEKLEQKNQELIEQKAEIEERIRNATSEETIRQYAESQGMIQIAD